MDIRTLALRQYDWVERMGWHNKTVLEAIALIASEIGEAAGECKFGHTTDHFGEELADIQLRILDLAQWQQIDLASIVPVYRIQWEQEGLFALEALALTMIDYGQLVNGARRDLPNDQFSFRLAMLFIRVTDIAQQNGVDLEAEILRKMEINEQRGTRGRRI